MREHVNKVFACPAFDSQRFVVTSDCQVLFCDMELDAVSIASEKAWSKVLFIMMEDEKAVLTFG